MMVHNNQRLFLVERKISEKTCKHCDLQLQKHDVCFSKRNKQYYCCECAITLGYIKIHDKKEAFLKGHLVGNV